MSEQTRGPDGRLIAVDEVHRISPFDPLTEADIEAASVPWWPGLREYEAHVWVEVVEGLSEVPR